MRRKQKWSITSSVHSRLNIPSIDKLCEHLANPNGALSAKTYLPPVIEISSPTTNAGKTQFCYYAIAATVTPPQLGGKGEIAVVLDTDSKFDVERLADVISGYLKASNTTDTEQPESKSTNLANAKSVVATCLSLVYIIKPQNLRSLANTIKGLPDRMLNRRSEILEQAVGLVLIDSVSSFYWQERWASELSIHGSNEPGNVGVESEISLDNAALLSGLRSLRTIFECPIVLTTWSLPLPSATSRLRARSLLPLTLRQLVSLHLTLVREEPVPFRRELDLRRLLQDREARAEALLEGRHSYFINPLEHEGGQDGANSSRLQSITRHWHITKDYVSIP